MQRKIKTVIVENGFEREVEIEVPDAPPASWGDLDKLRILGKRHPRLEGPDKVTGRAKYASDIVLPGMCYGRFLTSAHAAARVASVDLSPAETMPGVKAVIGLINAGASVNYSGQPIAAVAAITPEIAEDAIRAIRVNYEPKQFVVDLDKARNPNSPPVRPDVPTNISGAGSRKNGDAAAAFQQAKVISENTYEAQTRLHCCLETHGQTSKWDGDKLTIWASTQFVTGVRDEFAAAAGGAQNVRAICEHMGGGFGSKFGGGPEGQAGVRLAKMANAPVKFLLTRADEQMANFRGPGVRAEIKLGAAEDGTLLAAQVKTFNNGGTGNAGTPLNEGFYIIPAQAHTAESVSVLTNTGGTAALRAPGHPQAAVVWDMALDEMAAKLGMDPIEFRKKNHQDPVRLKEWEIGAEVIGWDRRQKVPGTAPGVRKRGIGMGSATWGGGGRKTADCTIVVGKDGSVKAMSAVQDLGTGVRNYFAGIIAEEFGLGLKDIAVTIGDSAFGPGHASGGSTTTPSVAPAVKISARDAKEQLVAVASRALGAKPEDIELVVGGKFQVKDQPAKNLSWKQLCATLPEAGLRVKGDWNNGGADLQAPGTRGCTFAEVDVDTETGKVRILKVVGVQDCGFVLNRLQAESQVVGSIIQGIGTALLEDRRMDNLTGRMLNPNFEEYKLCGSFEAGGINVNMDPPYRTLGKDERAVVAIVYDNPTGKVSGIGEPAVIGVQASIANAIFNAIGVHVASQPATPDKVLAALASKKGAMA